MEEKKSKNLFLAITNFSVLLRLSAIVNKRLTYSLEPFLTAGLRTTQP